MYFIQGVIANVDIHVGNKALCNEKQIPKIRVYYGSGWVGPGLTRNFVCGKCSQNSSKPVLIF